MQTRIQSADMQAITDIAAQKGLKLSTVLDAVIQAGLTEIQSAQRYELLQTGILLVRDGGQDAPPASRRNQRASTARPKSAVNKARAQGGTRSNTDSPLTATTTQTQPSVAQSTPQRAQRAPEAATGPLTASTAQTQPQVTHQPTPQPAQQAPEATADPQTAATPQAQLSVPTKTPVPPFLTGEMIPAEIYKDLTDYEKKCLGLEAFLLSPDGGVVLRDEPPITSDGTRIPAGTWRILYTSFFPGDDLDNFVGLTWKIKDK